MKTAVSVTLLLILAAFRSGQSQNTQYQDGIGQGQNLLQNNNHQPQVQDTGANGGNTNNATQRSQPNSNSRSTLTGDPHNAAANFGNVNNPVQTSSVSSRPWATPQSTPLNVDPPSSPNSTKLFKVPPPRPSIKPEQNVSPGRGTTWWTSTRKSTYRNKPSKSSTKQMQAANAPYSDSVKYDPPGANAPNTTYDGLEQAYDEVSADTAKEINSGLRQFALDLLMERSVASPGKNVVMSPYSVWAVMLVIYEGASGRTASQIAKTLQINDKKMRVRANYKTLERTLRNATKESRSEFVRGNGIFYDVHTPPLPDFQKRAMNDYKCQLIGVNFTELNQAVHIINNWVTETTKQRIKLLVSPGDINRPELIITNALFFKGQWKIPFNKSATHTDKFYDEKKHLVANVPMMYQKGEYMYSFISEIGAHVLDMPYEDSKFRMLIVLPKPTSTVDEVLKLMKQFPVDQCYERLVHEQEMFSEDEVHVYLPRFKFKNRMELSSNLQNMGIVDVFDSGKANLSAMSDAPLFLAKVFHVSEIEVNEEGTIASAATAGSFVNKMGPPKFIANRPFAYFLIEDSQKTVIFVGKVMNPNLSS